MDKKKISALDKERAERIRGVRKSEQLTQEKMAERMDINASTYQRIENGRNNISFELLSKIKKEFGVSSDYILFGNIKEMKEYEIEFERMSDKEKFSLLLRLLMHISKIKDINYEELIADIEKYIK